MKFEYERHIAIDPLSGEPQEIQRPEVPITIHGPTGSYQSMALVDSGADFCALPKRLASLIGVAIQPTIGAGAEAVGGHRLNTWFGDVIFELGEAPEVLRWPATVLFFESEDDSVLLGHAGFLHCFQAMFDGFALELTLIPAPDFPHLA